MAELEVQPKRSGSWWIWLLLALIALAILFFLFKGCNTGTTATGSGDSIQADSSGVVAATGPNWDNVDFNSPATSYEEVTDADIVVTGNDRYTIYSLGENILFGPDQSTLQPGAEAKLKMVATSLERRFKGASIGVYGSADSTGTKGHNLAIGAERAEAVKNWLTRNGVTADKISVHSLGESEPVSSNATASGRKQNRNVQIVAFSEGTNQ
ncbi:OmpA family protein [Hufsiella ginkgonis]|uniref:OmpA family protein n=1 Tax=Hufsiella ginkgonis TaxID=2695274 RepID=A0A7K1Y067_9SPHI|nr:OmpA family protein [Hufsiella ginkgonis]MXV16664.1 OmpA family protein [Hufsiella ginkgonis]